ncbi:Glutamine cyclotransferase [bacterium A37T11]|nr:Glutamine cyclotransferase [bacterium A37T11]
MMILKRLMMLVAVVSSIAGCNTQRKATELNFKTPEAGTLIKKGDKVAVQMNFPTSDTGIDSVVYLLDNRVIASKKDITPVSFPTDSLNLGSRSITTRLYQGGKQQEAFSNIVLVSPKAPEQFSFSVVKTYPHDTSAFTQGLEYHDGIFYESTGLLGESSLRKVSVNDGKVLKKIDLPKDIFGEGLAVLPNNTIVMLTWRNGKGFVYDKNTFEKRSEFPFQASKEGWGLCFDGTRLIKSDGTNCLYFLNKETCAEEGYIEVYNDKGPVDSLNELEYINGLVYANVYQQDIIVVIDPKTGEVLRELNLIGLLPQKDHFDDTDYLNGIAYDAAGKRLFVTGKKWDSLFEIKILPRN